MKDPVFGNLEYEYGWNGTVEFNCFGRREEIALTVSGEEDDPITEYQYNSFRAFMEMWERIMGDTVEAIKEYYLGLRKELGYDQEYNADYPPLDNTDSVLKMISLTGSLTAGVCAWRSAARGMKRTGLAYAL